MTPLDLLLLLPLIVGTVKGYRRGLVLEVVSLLAFVLGVVGGLYLLSAAIPLVRSYLGELFGLLPLVAFLLVLVGIMWGVHLLGGLVKTAVHFTPLGVLDNLLGGTALAGLPLLAPSLTAGSVVLPWVVKATPLALQLTSYVLPFAHNLLARLKSAM
jgi:membrane protein required for colicin V production